MLRLDGLHHGQPHPAKLEIGRDSAAAISATGLPDSVTFTGTTATAGSWPGISLYRLASSNSRLENCRILYGGRNHLGILHIKQTAPRIRGCEIGWSSNNCVVLTESQLQGDTLEAYNWIHDPGEGFEEVEEEGG